MRDMARGMLGYQVRDPRNALYKGMNKEPKAASVGGENISSFLSRLLHLLTALAVVTTPVPVTTI
jgi:hypothetical protein